MSFESPFSREDDFRSKQRNKNKSVLTLNKQEFFRDLMRFHESRGTPIVKFPKISGNGTLSDIDLYKLYDQVISKGGWMKVNSKNEWSEIEKELGFPEKCVNSELALKHIYIRFFDKYERVNFLGEEKDRIDEEDEENRHKRWSARALHSIPSSYNHSHHNISYSVRESNKLSTDLYQPSEYDKLAMSLLSPLPNEQDFAINVLTLMSNECKQTLRLGKCTRLIGILLAHAGCFEHQNLREMFNEFYSRIRGHSLESFWRETLIDKPDFYYLVYDDIFNNEEENDLKKAPKTFSSKDLPEHEFLSLGRQLGTRDYIGQRVHQVLTIIRNLSFFDENILILAKDKTLLRFLVMCANIRWSNIHMMALDILGNICNEVELNDPFADLTSRHLFGTIADEIESSDRATIISAMEILSKLCAKDENEEFLLKHFKRENYKFVSNHLIVPDMMLLVYTLECIYSLTSLGEKACNAFVEIRGFVDTVVSLVTIEAQSLGSDSCIQMKVIETVPTRQIFQSRPHVLPQNIVVQKANIPDQQRTVYQSPTKFASPQTDVKTQQQQIQENEQFAIAWIKNNFELSPSLMVKIEEHDMYRMYLNACTKIGRKGVISQLHFPRVVRSIFGVSVGPNANNVEGAEKVVNYYCGIKPRAMTLPAPQTNADGNVVKTEVQVSIKTEESSLAAQLKTSQSLLQQALSTSQSMSSQTAATTSSASGLSSPTTSTSLIKSLLANKVTIANSNVETTTQLNVVSSMLPTCVTTTTSLHQVAQRQQISQKQKQLSELQASIPVSHVTSSTKMVVTSSASNVVKTISIKPSVITAESKPVVVTQNDPPPLAPLSTTSNKPPGIITINQNSQDGKVLVSPKLSANKMLVDLLDKKTEPQFVTIKRKTDSECEIPSKKIDLDGGHSEVTPSPKAADLYAKLASSLLEDEDMEEDDDEIEKAVPAKIIEKKIIEVKPQVQQRQIIMGPNNQVILSPNSAHQTTTATIKTDSGIQSVPIIIQQPTSAIIQQPAPTQYILATNQQGQTYVVAQQPMSTPQMPQQILLAQTPGQQGQKTIIILQQPQGQQQQQQKIIMTPGGQQVIYSSPVQRQVIQPNPPQASIIQSSSSAQASNRKIVITNTVDSTGKIIQQTTQQAATKMVQASSHQTLQAIAQGQNIIMQKGQKYQIGSTQITQIVNPAATSSVPVQKVSSPAPEVSQVVTMKESSVTITSKPLETNEIQQTLVPSKSPTDSEKSDEKDEEELKTVESEVQKESLVPTKSSTPTSQTSSGTSSPAPSNKQTISIQIPVPQSQIAGANAQQYTIKIIPSMDPSIKIKDEDVEPSWPYICEWRGCPKKKFNTANEVYLHACAIHCPSLDGNPDLFCQWGGGNTLCDNLPRKRFSLMTHILDRHCTNDVLKLSATKRVTAAESGQTPQPQGQKQPYPVTLYRQPNPNASQDPSGASQSAGMAAMQAIKRHSVDFVHLKDVALQDEVEGTVTKSIRLTAALIIRNLASYSNSAKRALRYHEAHLSQIALSNLESNRVAAQILYEINEQISPFSRP